MISTFKLLGSNLIASSLSGKYPYSIECKNIIDAVLTGYNHIVKEIPIHKFPIKTIEGYRNYNKEWQYCSLHSLLTNISNYIHAGIRLICKGSIEYSRLYSPSSVTVSIPYIIHILKCSDSYYFLIPSIFTNINILIKAASKNITDAKIKYKKLTDIAQSVQKQIGKGPINVKSLLDKYQIAKEDPSVSTIINCLNSAIPSEHHVLMKILSQANLQATTARCQCCFHSCSFKYIMDPSNTCIQCLQQHVADNYNVYSGNKRFLYLLSLYASKNYILFELFNITSKSSTADEAIENPIVENKGIHFTSRAPPNQADLSNALKSNAGVLDIKVHSIDKIGQMIRTKKVHN